MNKFKIIYEHTKNWEKYRKRIEVFTNYKKFRKSLAYARNCADVRNIKGLIKCSGCKKWFDEENQSWACPHKENGDSNGYQEL